MHQKRKEEWKKLDHEKLKKYMRCDYRSSALYICGKNISQLTLKEKHQLMVSVFNNFFRFGGYSQYSYLFSDLFSEAFKNEIEEVGKDKMDRYLSRYIIKMSE